MLLRDGACDQSIAMITGVIHTLTRSFVLHVRVLCVDVSPDCQLIFLLRIAS